MNNKVMIIGLDGARMDIIYNWCKQGYLPNFNKIINGGVYGKLETVLPIHSFPAWTSLSTGNIPTKHGIYDVMLRKKHGEYERIVPNSNLIKNHSSMPVKRFWEILDDLGYCCAIINVPVTYPPKPLKNGVIVSSVLTPSINHTYAHPKYVLKMLRNQNYKIMPKSQPGTEEYIKETHEILKKQYKFLEWFMKEYNWDCVFWVIMSTEMLHHHYASFIDQKHNLYNPIFEIIVRDLYVKIDTYLGEIMNINNELNLFLVSDHGFAPYYGTIYINSLLRKLGFLKTKNKLYSMKSKILNLIKKHGKRFYKYAPKNIQEMAINITGFGSSEFTLNMIDWFKTAAYVPILDGHIYLNCESREKNGIIKKEEYEKVTYDIIKSMYKINHIKDIIEKFLKKEKIYKEGDYLDLAPDIFIMFKNDNERPFKIRTNPFVKKVINNNLKLFKENIGYHTLYGIFLAYGKNIKQSYHYNVTITDIAPTVLAMFGIEKRSSHDGVILKDIFVDCEVPILNTKRKIQDARK